MNINARAFALLLPLTSACGGEMPSEGATPETATSTSGITTSGTRWYYNHHGFAGTLGAPSEVVSGDFDGNGRSDLAVLRHGGLIATAYNNRSGLYSVVYTPTSIISRFWDTWAAAARQVVVGDFNGDGRDDIALVGGSGWTSIPMLRGRASGGFDLHMEPQSTFCFWAAYPGVQAVAGDFDNNGRDDIALAGGASWSSVVVGYNSNWGGMSVIYGSSPAFASLATGAGAELHAGDFNGDGDEDLALTGGYNFSSIPFALSLGNGNFTYTTRAAPNLVVYSKRSHAKVVTGDFDADGDDDFAVVGGTGNVYLRFAFTKPSWGTWYLHEWSKYDVTFSGHASAANAAVAGRVDTNSHDDILLLNDALDYAEVELIDH